MTSLRERWHADLREAIRARDRVRISALRGVLAAVANAEAVSVARAGSDGPLGAVGVGSTEVARRMLGEDEVLELLRAECSERERAAVTIASRNPERAERLRSEAAVLAAYVQRTVR